ncbi:MAG: hypothetical protein KF799_13670 [Bdellovibrionales bacterium]|nr:hypothetical protein [Bdellovibrionales bacterium]
MLEFGACPLCKQDISPERKKLSPVICNHCGFTFSKDSLKTANDVESKSIKIMVAISVVVSACYIQISHWDKAWLEIVPLALKETIGMSSPSDIEQKAGICFEQMKWDCVEAQYGKAAQNDPALWERAAGFQMKRAKYNEAAQSYYKFFQSGGVNLESQYNYAKALAQLGQVDEAVKYFDQVLAAKPDVLQITVVQNYVKLLMDHQRFDQAKLLISKVRKDGGPAAESFMETEYKQITQVTTASRE